MARTFVKDPDSKLDYKIDWAAWLGGSDTISTSTWTVPDGITKASDTNDDNSTTIWVSGGIAGNDYNLVNHIVTAADREADRTIRIQVRER